MNPRKAGETVAEMGCVGKVVGVGVWFSCFVFIGEGYLVLKMRGRVQREKGEV